MTSQGKEDFANMVKDFEMEIILIYPDEPSIITRVLVRGRLGFKSVPREEVREAGSWSDIAVSRGTQAASRN